GSIVDTVSDLNAAGAVLDRTITTTSANGLSKTIQREFTGSGTINQTDEDDVVISANGGTTQTVTCFNGDENASVAYQIVTTTSANGLSKETQYDDTGAGNFNMTSTDDKVLNADGSTVETLALVGSNNNLVSVDDQTITTTSADGKTINLQRTLGN